MDKGRLKGVKRNRPTGMKYVLTDKFRAKVERQRKLSAGDIVKIKEDRESGMTLRALGKKYGVNCVTIMRNLEANHA